MVYDLTQPSKAPVEYGYVLDSLKTAISEILAVNDYQFLVDGSSDSIVPLANTLFADLGALLNEAKPFVTRAGGYS